MSSNRDYADIDADQRGDIADQADRLSAIMAAEAIANARSGGAGEGSLDGLDIPLEDTDALVAVEDAEDASDDPFHAGGFETDRSSRDEWVPAELAAMHVVDPERDLGDPDRTASGDEPTGPTPEDQTLLGVDPYEPG